MNILKTYALPTDKPDTFLIHWTNSSLVPKGVLKVRVTARIEDKQIASELAAMQHLLEQKCVIGQNAVGCAGIKLFVSSGAIRKLHRRQSNKAHLAPYANFLTTRFAGCQISVEKDSKWFKDFVPENLEHMLVSGPHRETIQVRGLGEVCITQHILDRFADRFLPAIPHDKRAQVAWLKLVELACDPGVYEVSRNNPWAGIQYNAGGRHEGRYFLNPNKKRILVITDNPREGKRLVTTYPATNQFHNLLKAA